MFATLTDQFKSLFSSLSKSKVLSEENLSDAIRQVRLALLDADVNFSVVSQIIKKIKEKALGQTAIKSVNPTEQFVEIVHTALIEIMGTEEKPLILDSQPTVILLCGLQGSGKTTSCAKLAAYLKKIHPKKKCLLAACDLQRPAAVAQLKKLADQVGIECALPQSTSALGAAKDALVRAKKEGFDVLIIDTAGRTEVAEDLMVELQEMKKALQPDEVLFVANAAVGQESLAVATQFNQRVEMTGAILTMLDGSARAGIALSIREMLGKPIKFEGVGEKIEDLQLFNPRSMADRILGFGDMINLVRRAKEQISDDEQDKLEKKLMTSSFTYDDYIKQMAAFRRMGPMKSLMKMMPGMPDMPDMENSEKEFAKTEAVILSMTPQERAEKVELVPTRRRRIAKGSGVPISEVDRLIKGFKRAKQMFKDLPQMKKKFKDMNTKENSLWR